MSSRVEPAGLPRAHVTRPRLIDKLTLAVLGKLTMVCANAGYGGLHTVKLKGLMADPGRVVELLKQSRGMRWIAVMDDASGAVFQELARSAGGRLISQGNHAYTEDVFPPLRNVWLAASPDQSAGGILASSLIERDGDFSIVESFLREPSTDSSPTGWSAPGFSSYRSADPNAIHLHCSGLSLSDGCGLLGMSASGGWTPISWRDGERESVTWQSGDWVESAGYDEENLPGSTFHILLPLQNKPPDSPTARLLSPLYNNASEEKEK